MEVQSLKPQAGWCRRVGGYGTVSLSCGSRLQGFMASWLHFMASRLQGFTRLQGARAGRRVPVGNRQDGGRGERCVACGVCALGRGSHIRILDIIACPRCHAASLQSSCMVCTVSHAMGTSDDIFLKVTLQARVASLRHRTPPG
jgi:hypothetical protein